MGVFERIILWHQTALVASILVNMFLAGTLAVVVHEFRKELARGLTRS